MQVFWIEIAELHDNPVNADEKRLHEIYQKTENRCALFVDISQMMSTDNIK